MDFGALAKDFEMEKDEFLEILNLFLESSYDDLKKLQSAIDEEDSLKAAHAAHSIKGAAMNLGLLEIYELAKSIERSAKENHLCQVHEMAKRAQEEIDRIGETVVQERQKE
ncbi:MAG: Hpt domain-containing protein [Deltaproteobacteria bacterium]|nr:Hpt domain-containing protein [Deltaproteobacteria bacterium]